MYRVTTPTNSFTLPFSTDECSVIQVTYKQNDKVLTKQYENGVCPSGMALDDDTILLSLTQEETKSFSKGKVTAQVRVLTTGGKAYASQKFTIGVNDVQNEDILQ